MSLPRSAHLGATVYADDIAVWSTASSHLAAWIQIDAHFRGMLMQSLSFGLLDQLVSLVGGRYLLARHVLGYFVALSWYAIAARSAGLIVPCRWLKQTLIWLT